MYLRGSHQWLGAGNMACNLEEPLAWLGKNNPADREPRSRFAAKRLAFHSLHSPFSRLCDCYYSLLLHISLAQDIVPLPRLYIQEETRLHAGSEIGTYALQLDQEKSIAPVWQTTCSRPRRTSLVRRAIAKQSSGRAYHGQACVQCYSEAVERVRLPWSGVRAVLFRSSRAGALTLVRRARSVRTQQSGGRAYHCQACAYAAVGRVCLPWSGVRAVL